MLLIEILEVSLIQKVSRKMFLTKIFGNNYNLRARFFPAVIAFAPGLMFVIVITNLFVSQLVLELLLPSIIILYLIIVAMLTDFVRDRGKEIEKMLFKEWGGIPSVAMLRENDNRISDPIKARYKKILSQIVLDLKFETQLNNCNSSIDKETIDTINESNYRNASFWLLHQTRDVKKFPLIHEENINYGSKRNKYALKNIAIKVGLISLFLIALFNLVIFSIVDNFSTEEYLNRNFQNTVSIISIITISIHLINFICFVSKEGVKIVSEDFARQLLGACDQFIIEPNLGVLSVKFIGENNNGYNQTTKADQGQKVHSGKEIDSA